MAKKGIVNAYRLENTHSSTRPIRAEVPQGSIPSTLLFSAYINDILRPTTGVQFALFADDTALLLRSNNHRNIVILLRLQRPIDELTQWLRLWRIECKLHVTSYAEVPAYKASIGQSRSDGISMPEWPRETKTSKPWANDMAVE
ncbi:hypothetical protein EVAR_19071_1 [Eumeta japonica]|uniref:Reverse transcriptase domain-containing protein n=1 Tax=Eumeta variegata TaxID=151549 RepID=A0A4C1UP20_EUMVA|nr:hypothetical protein EVAR_19071_1 [Eumeta japonica]